ncbi:MAG TPA: aldo/keto reductase [Planctomycetota bacterium]|jgi:voltage-dependent potassium channel beta subunit|nr:aldo/keto reductase [Planctomycetota bacterium]
MQYRRLGRSGLKLSALSFGSWVTFSTQVDDRAAGELMKLAYEAGVNFFDNAEAYAAGESERIMGRVLEKMAWKRDTYCVSSKVFWGGKLPTQRGLSKKHVRDACDAALARLRVDYLDLYFCHRPDPETPIEETVRAMHELVAQGKVLYWGTSEWSAAEIAEAFGVARAQNLTPPTMEQPQYNLFERTKVEREFARLYESFGIGTTIWSPLASGVLTGKYAKGVPAGSRMSLPEYGWLKERLESAEGRARVAKVRELEVVAQSVGATLAQLAIAWCLANPHVSTVILGATKPAQLAETLTAVEILPKLKPDVLARIEAIVGSKPAAAEED